jgi:hypothetical protein
MNSRPHSQRNRIAPGKSAGVRISVHARSSVDANLPKRSSKGLMKAHFAGACRFLRVSGFRDLSHVEAFFELHHG